MLTKNPFISAISLQGRRGIDASWYHPDSIHVKYVSSVDSHAFSYDKKRYDCPDFNAVNAIAYCIIHGIKFMNNLTSATELRNELYIRIMYRFTPPTGSLVQSNVSFFLHRL